MINMIVNIPKERLTTKIKICCIYKITNNTNGKIYIGQSTDLRRRISEYRHPKMEGYPRPIIKAIFNEGSENFTLDILKECEPDKLTEYENKYIKELESTDPEKGYNITKYNYPSNNDEESRKRKSESHKGLKESSDTKRKKSNKILAIKDKTLVVCDSGKLFGDFVNKGKDYIKNCLRHPSMVEGYNIYYADYDKRQVIREKMNNKRCIRNLEYMSLLDILDKAELEGVETITSIFSVATLSYDNLDENKKPVLKVIKERKTENQEQGTDYLAG